MKLLIFITLIGLVASAEAQTAVSEKFDKWEAAIFQLEMRQKNEPAQANTIVCYGSSSIRLWDSITEELAPWPIAQRGYGGAKLADIIHFAPRILGPYLGAENPRRCRAVLLFVANDITGKNPDEPTAQDVAKRFQELLSWIREQDATIPVFWLAVTPANSRWQAWPEIRNSTDMIKAIAAEDERLHVISTAGAFLGVDGKPRNELFRADQLHLNAAGYQVWSSLIKAALDSELGPAVELK